MEASGIPSRAQLVLRTPELVAILTSHVAQAVQPGFAQTSKSDRSDYRSALALLAPVNRAFRKVVEARLYSSLTILSLVGYGGQKHTKDKTAKLLRTLEGQPRLAALTRTAHVDLDDTTVGRTSRLLRAVTNLLDLTISVDYLSTPSDKALLADLHHLQRLSISFIACRGDVISLGCQAFLADLPEPSPSKLTASPGTASRLTQHF